METTDRNPDLWRQAKDRARFKASLFSFVVVNALLWALWAVTGRESHPIPWPLWVSFFWGVGLVLKAIRVYSGFGWAQLSEREYEKLVQEQQNNLR
ncbi:2TM domain-containing protein [Hymenobacter sp. NST-14]|uniref:2TM domain-containing protein n=1 Tax=Hymenobacter piscis TaxID=2839984 RepID=UPI001C01F30B|nr:2TM domain-containing protein [Hymenobacter piscis]MBT9393400.1 2TM domain-containing protein [Hymenobacter piscis]